MLNGLISLLPVFAFLAALVFLDSYKLVNFRSILLTILVGCAMTIPPFLFSGVVLGVLHIGSGIYSLYGGPIVEELCKALYMIYLMRQKRVGFGVDAAIYGFSIGAGFSLVENIYYLESLPGQHILLWVARGLGTAVMHGGSTALFALITKSLSDRGGLKVRTMIPGLAAAIVMHSFYNHFLLSPLVPTALLLALFPVIFQQSEKTTRKWLGVGLDTDLQLLDIITSGDIAQTRIGDYFRTLQQQFRSEIIVDMICLVRLHTELAIRAKGLLMMRSRGFNPPSGPELPEKFAELKYLQKSIGKTGQLALAPLLHMSSRDLWQIHMLRG